MSPDGSLAHALPRLEWVRPPQQERSQRTLERILDAAELLFLQKGFERTGVAEICQKAGSSVGAFYARFPDKHALLRQVHDRFSAQGIATAEAALDPAMWKGVPLSDFLRAAVRFLMGVFHERRELIAALSHCEANDPDLIGFGQRVGKVLGARAYDFLLARNQPMTHPDPREAIHFLCWIILNALEGHTAHINAFQPLPPDRLIDHIVDMCLSHLGTTKEA